MNDINVLIVGVGGQGTLLASKILGNVALREGCQVKVSEVHGMSQRAQCNNICKNGKSVFPVIDKEKRIILFPLKSLRR